MGKLIDGKAIAAGIREDLKSRVMALKAKGIDPCLSVIIVGEDSASQIYVRNKEKACQSMGIESKIHRMSENSTKEEIVSQIQRINEDRKIHGLLVQLPLPKGLKERDVLVEISPKKDVDGLHVDNLGRLFKGETPLFMPCTPLGIIELIRSTGMEIAGREAVVVGRSNIVGKPISIMLLQENATVTICHSKTTNLGEVIRRADIVVAAVGREKLIKGSMIKTGAIVIDVGMNRSGNGLFGDVDFVEAKEIASYITPVPGGVGPMTIAMLLKNTVIAAERA